MTRALAAVVIGALAVWLIAVVALRQYLPCDVTMQLEGKTPEFFRCVMEKRR